MTSVQEAGEGERCLRLGVLNWMPFMFIGQAPPFKFVGTMVEVMDIFAKKLNFCYEFVVPEDWMFGVVLPNGSWTGIMGKLVSREFDISGVVLTIDPARAAAVDFTEPLYMDAQALAYRRPVLEADIAGFVKPYTDTVWMLIGATMLAVFVGICGIYVSERNLLSRVSRGVQEEGQQSKSESTWHSFQWTLGSTLAMSLPWEPRSNSLRVVGGLYLLSALIIGTVYRSNLKAMLILPKLRLPFESLEELVETDIPCNVPNGSMMYQAIMDAPEGSLLYQLKDHIIDTRDVKKAMADVVLGKNAVFIGKSLIDYTIHRTYALTRTCPLYIAPRVFLGMTALCLAFPKGSPLRDKFNPIIRNLKEFGILQYQMNKELYHTRECQKRESVLRFPETLAPLELENYYGVFILYAAGMFLASVCFLLELLLGRRYRT